MVCPRSIRYMSPEGTVVQDRVLCPRSVRYMSPEGTVVQDGVLRPRSVSYSQGYYGMSKVKTEYCVQGQ